MRIKDPDTMKASLLHWRKLIFVIALHCSSFPAFSVPSKRLLLCFQSSAYSLSRSYSKNAFTFLHNKRLPTDTKTGETDMVTCAAIRLLHSMALNLHYCCSTGTQAFQEILMHVCFDDCG